VVINYARHWAFARGEIKVPEVSDELDKYYSPRQRQEIEAVIRRMDFSNKLNNLYAKPLKD